MPLYRFKYSYTACFVLSVIVLFTRRDEQNSRKRVSLNSDGAYCCTGSCYTKTLRFVCDARYPYFGRDKQNDGTAVDDVVRVVEVDPPALGFFSSFLFISFHFVRPSIKRRRHRSERRANIKRTGSLSSVQAAGIKRSRGHGAKRGRLKNYSRRSYPVTGIRCRVPSLRMRIATKKYSNITNPIHKRNDNS